MIRMQSGLLLLMGVMVTDSVVGEQEVVRAIAGSNVPQVFSGGYLLQLFLGMLVVIACIALLAWIFRRMGGIQSGPLGLIRIVSGLSVGAREKVVLLQVGETQVLLGIAPGRITTLHTFAEPVDISGGADKNQSNFAKLFSSAKGQEGKS